jgi:hypothetical protein
VERQRNLNSAAATFNRVDVRRPSLALNASAATVNITDLSAFTEKAFWKRRRRFRSCRNGKPP